MRYHTENTWNEYLDEYENITFSISVYQIRFQLVPIRIITYNRRTQKHENK